MKLLSRFFAKRACKDAAAPVCASLTRTPLTRTPLFEQLENRQLMTAVHFAPQAPTDLTAASASTTSIELHWKDNSTRETGYKIFRSTDDKSFTQINAVKANTTSYDSGNLTKGKKYYYKVAAYDSSSTSIYTNIASTTAGGSSSSTSTSSSSSSSSSSSNSTGSSVSSTPVSSGVNSSNFAGITVNSDQSPSKLIPILRKLHVKTVRLFFGMITWENRAGDASLAQAKAYRAAGFNVIMNVNAPQVPSYAEATAFFTYIKNKPGALSDVNIWEIGNEPDRPPFWHGTASQYVNTILKAAYTVLHPAGAKILGAGPSWSPDYAQQMVNAGYLKYVDYAGMHPYGNSVQQVIQRATDAAKVYAGKPMILSEWNVRGATSTSQWISELNQIAPALKKVANEAIYFCLVKTFTMAGPAGVINTDGSPNGGFYNMYANWYS